jgi:hypothetical protein
MARAPESVSSLSESVDRNLSAIRSAVAECARQHGRDKSQIRLIAVTKTHPVAALEAAFAHGQSEFGENTVQEGLTKIPQFTGRGIHWHFIGHLQSNKVKHIPGNFSWVHSLDSVKLAARLSRFAQEQGVVVQTLVEVNVTGDPKKHGVAPKELHSLIDRLMKADTPGIRLRGLMTIGPYPAEEKIIRATYAKLRQLRDDCVLRFGLQEFGELSMGMSGDYLEAVKEGSTMLRIGAAIFGKREYPK